MVVTFGDVAQRLSDSFTFTQGGKDRIERLARKAADDAYTNISAVHPWFYLRKRAQLNINGAYNTGTIAFNATTRVLTLTDGIFPANAVLCDLMINRNLYLVETRTDDTHLVLKANACPVEDLPAGTSYALAQTRYELPADYVELRGLTEIERFWNLTYISPEMMLQQAQLWYTPTIPWYFTVIGYGGMGRLYMQFAPPPSEDRTFYIIYQAKPRPRTMSAMYTTGRVTTTSGSTTVTVTNGGSLPSGVGSGNIFRISTTDQLPTGPFGNNPYAEERQIKSRTSATSFELWEPMTISGTGLYYSVDDPVDLENMSMQTLYDRMAEGFVVRLQNMTPALVGAANHAIDIALAQAKAADSRLNPGASINQWGPMSIGEAIYLSGTQYRP